jgi:hypothetical protein
MLAYQLPIPVRYELWTTLASMVAAIITSGFALYIVTHGALTWRRLIVSGAIMGAGIGTMHYTGMAAMRLDALVMYNIGPWLLSVANAIVCSTIAIWLVFRIGGSCDLNRVLSALVIGVRCGHALHRHVRDHLRVDRSVGGRKHGAATRAARRGNSGGDAPHHGRHARGFAAKPALRRDTAGRGDGNARDRRQLPDAALLLRR